MFELISLQIWALLSIKPEIGALSRSRLEIIVKYLKKKKKLFSQKVITSAKANDFENKR